MRSKAVGHVDLSDDESSIKDAPSAPLPQPQKAPPKSKRGVAKGKAEEKKKTAAVAKRPKPKRIYESDSEEDGGGAGGDDDEEESY